MQYRHYCMAKMFTSSAVVLTELILLDKKKG